jgi:hypothetical protein
MQQYKPSWNLASVPGEVFYAEAARRMAVSLTQNARLQASIADR